MSSAVIIQVADAVTTELNNAVASALLSKEFTAVRRHKPEYKLPDLTDLKVAVVPQSQGISAASRGSAFWEIAVNVGVLQRVPDDAEIDDLLGLVQEIIDLLYRTRLETFQAAPCTAVESDPAVDSEQLDKSNVLLSLITATYRVRR